MRDESYTTEVRDQYEQYPFPYRRPEDERERLIVSEVDHLSKIDHHCFGGRRDFTQPLRILIAGGGTGDALIFLAEQLRGCPCEFVFLDMSARSLETARARCAVRGIERVQWVHGSLIELDALGLGEFDYINCIGVLHHLPEPRAGLEQLTRSLAVEGGMGLMLYGKYGRKNAYLVQELLGLMQAKDEPLAQRVEVARAALLDLGETRRVHIEGAARELLRSSEADAYLVDTYLHGIDQAYTVSDLHELLASCGLSVAGFTNFFDAQGANCALEYDPGLYFQEPQLVERVTSLAPAARGHVAELLNGSISMHAFYVSRRVGAAAVVVDPEHAAYPTTTYAQRALEALVAEAPARVQLRLAGGVQRELPLTPVAHRVLAAIDGRTPLGQLVRDLCGEGPNAEGAGRERVEREVYGLLDLLTRLGLVSLRLASLTPLPPGSSERPWTGAIDLRPFAALTTNG